MKYCHSPADIKSVPHYAAVIFRNVHIPGDERSRTNPGHGYPDSTEAVCDYIRFDTKLDMETWVKRQESQKFRTDSYVVIESFPKTIVTTFNIV